MKALAPTELLVENDALARLHALSVTTARGVDLDDAAERNDGSAVLLIRRANAALRKLNPHRSGATLDPLATSLSRPPHATLIENNRGFTAC